MENQKILLVDKAYLSLGGQAIDIISKYIEDLSAKRVERGFQVTI